MKNNSFIRDLINELLNSSNLKWEREEGFICVDTITENYNLSICKHTNEEKISYYVHVDNEYFEGFVTPNDDIKSYKELERIYDTAYSNAVVFYYSE